jgi:hypothetical protein
LKFWTTPICAEDVNAGARKMAVNVAPNHIGKVIHRDSVCNGQTRTIRRFGLYNKFLFVVLTATRQIVHSWHRSFSGPPLSA